MTCQACAVHVCVCGMVSVVLAASPYFVILLGGKVSSRMFHTMHEGMFIDNTDTGDVGSINDIKCDRIYPWILWIIAASAL